MGPCGPQIQWQYLWSSDPVTIFMILKGRSPAHEIISVLFSTGTVTPCDLGHCGITPLNVLWLKALRKKSDLGKTVTGVLCISYRDFQLFPLPMWPLENFLQPRGGYSSAAGPGGLLCWSHCSPPASPRTCCTRVWLCSLSPPSQNYADLGLFAHVHL